MPFPTLSKLAAKSVAQGINDETISLDFPLDTKSSNAIVGELLKLDENNFKKLEVFRNHLSVTKIDFRSFNIDAAAVRNLSNFNLVSLDFGQMFHLEEYFPGDPWDNESLDIVSLLIQSTNISSRRSMAHLGLRTDLEFIAGWETEVSEILPNLQSIDISFRIYNETFRFSNFCFCFPNLLVLDISDADGLSSLQGIRNLKNLQKLTMQYVKLEDVGGYEELSELKNLKYLDVSNTNQIKELREDRDWQETNSIKDMLAAGVRMEALEFLDCSWTSVTEHELETFAKNHPSLKTIATICTACDQTTISGVKMLNMSSRSSMSESLEYALLAGRDGLALDFIKKVLEKLKTSRENLSNTELRPITNAILFVLRESFDEHTKFWTLDYYLESGLFEHEISISMFSTDIPDMIELFYNVFNRYHSTVCKIRISEFVFRMLEATVNSVRPGILIPDRVLSFVFEKTFDLDRQFPENRTQAIRIICQALVWMTLEQHQSLNFELLTKVTVFLNSAFVF
ncbi:hypothetical protein B9Z55_004872 [Caenorhabditis nigoni]|uniref:Uncharacterized protein n=1 Tax=Caenorhabditis nigoni TaxID=1611254 RepID=A0A2G5UYD8_9PELO|nr:hypothetical protein B9Z55_004872 [Caenorhabditis nigoni]